MHNPWPNSLVPTLLPTAQPDTSAALFFSTFRQRSSSSVSLFSSDGVVQSQAFGARTLFNSLPVTLFAADPTLAEILEQVSITAEEQPELKEWLAMIFLELQKLNENLLNGGN